MVEGVFYKEVYRGTSIPEAAFPEFAARAVDALERLGRYYTLTGGEDARKMAICAIAEEIYASTGRRGGVSAAAVGSVRVSYNKTQRAIYDAAATYLDIYRGVVL